MEGTKSILKTIPLLKTKAGPRDVDLWPQRLKEEYQSLIQVNANNIIIILCSYRLKRHNFNIGLGCHHLFSEC